jgi:hypothetical protein
VSFENVRAAKTTGLYCSRTGSTETLMSSDAACNNEYQRRKCSRRERFQKKSDKNNPVQVSGYMERNVYLVHIGPYFCELLIKPF